MADFLRTDTNRDEWPILKNLKRFATGKDEREDRLECFRRLSTDSRLRRPGRMLSREVETSVPALAPGGDPVWASLLTSGPRTSRKRAGAV
jgi:hypothetical protein